MLEHESILTINGGSSSIKFSLYRIGKPIKQIFFGQVDEIGSAKATLRFTKSGSGKISCISIKAATHNEAVDHLIVWLEKQESFGSIKAIGHRIVQGMKHTDPEFITPALIRELKKISDFDPDHLPEEIKLIEIFRKRYPTFQQFACFDTAFHAGMPIVAKLLSIPRRYYDKGIRRYGFHGLSYSFLMQELESLDGKQTAQGRIILAHLGSGASLAAVKDGRCIDTTMGFTPASGLLMGTRTGDLDPGVAWYLMKFEKLSPKEFNHLINHESGLLGISGTSSNMRELIESEDVKGHAKDAIDLFCYQAKKWIGSFAATLGGLDTLVFAGGIGEHSPAVRSKICDGLKFLGIELNEIDNMNNKAIIAAGGSKVNVRIIKTNEELMIARLVNDMLNKSIKESITVR